MLRHRVIPSLLIDNGDLVKTTKFKSKIYVGDPINAIKIFNDKEVDELLVLDISVTKKNIEPNYELIKNFASECFMPLTYGGGIRNLEQASKIFDLGVEKISIQTAAFYNLPFIADLITKFGSQSVVICVDIKRNWFNNPVLYNAANSESVNGDWLLFLKKMEDIGVGEIILNSVDNEGVFNGFDLELIKKACHLINIPIIAMGGAGNLTHFKDAINAGASSVAAGSMFVFYGPHKPVLITYPDYKDLELLFYA